MKSVNALATVAVKCVAARRYKGKPMSMKITKTQLKEIIKEELAIFEYVEPQEGKRTPDDAEVLVKGFGVLRLGQVRDKLVRDYLTPLKETSKNDEYMNKLAGFLSRGVMMAFYNTLKEHNALEGL